MIITHHRKKLINAIIYFSQNTQHCGKIKLLKLLYFLDFFHFKQTGKSVTGLDYYAWQMGPVPRDLFVELTDNPRPDMKEAIKPLDRNQQFQQIIPRKKFNPDFFSKKELDLLKNLSFVFRDAKADVMIESTHLKNHPWDRTLREKGEFQQIDYMLAVDEDKDSLSPEEAWERASEIAEMRSLFGVS